MHKKPLKDYYKILGLKTGESDSKKIQKAWRGKILMCHHDLVEAELSLNKKLRKKQKDKILSEAHEKSVLVNEAYEVLSDPEKKMDYDARIRNEPFSDIDSDINSDISGSTHRSRIKTAKWDRAKRGRNEQGNINLDDLLGVIVEKLCYQYLGKSPFTEVRRDSRLEDAVFYGFVEVENIDFYEELGNKLRNRCGSYVLKFMRNYLMINESHIDLPFSDSRDQANYVGSIAYGIDEIREELDMKRFFIRGDTCDSEKGQALEQLLEYMIDYREEIMVERAELRGTEEEKRPRRLKDIAGAGKGGNRTKTETGR